MKHENAGYHEGELQRDRKKIHKDTYKHGIHGHHDHHLHMVMDFRRRFWISLAASVPVLALSPFLQSVFGIKKLIDFPGEIYVLFILSSFIFIYGGYPFLKGLIEEIGDHQTGMMTLIGLASFGIILSPVVGAILMSLSTIIVAINARIMKFETP